MSMSCIMVFCGSFLLSSQFNTAADGADGTKQFDGQIDCWDSEPFTYETCCLPVPNPSCWNEVFTAEKCCHDPSEAAHRSPLQRLHEELYVDANPYDIMSKLPFRAGSHYPDSHLTAEIVRDVIELIGTNISLWLEVGSFLGDSASTTAVALKAMGVSAGIICMDTFSGDVGMWATRKGMRTVANHPGAESALQMDEYGHVRIYETFLANMIDRGHNDIVMPIRVSSLVGMRLLQRLRDEQRIDVLPQIIYLDSAHEQGETLLELRQAWEILPTPGILFGDDWSWDGVRTDVSAFAESMRFQSFSETELRLLDTSKERCLQPVPGVALVPEHDGTWVMFKRRQT